jgi:ADP-heptose:LPS heptosyltransferase
MNLKLKQFIDVYIGRVLLGVNLVLVRGLGLLLRRNHSIDKHPENIVVIKILGLGSIIMASDAIHSMKLHFPNTRFTLLCGKGVAKGIEPLELFDEIICIDDKNVFSMLKSTAKFMVKALSMKKLWVVDLEVYSILTTILSAWTCAKNRFGFQLDKTNFRNYLNTHNTYFNQFVRVDINYRKLAESMGVKNFKQFLFPQKFMSSDSSRNWIIINNTCSELGGHLRKLPDSKLTQICNFITTQTSYNIALVGAPIDNADIDDFIQLNKLDTNRVKNVAGKLTFDEYYNFLGTKGRLMLSIDSAPLHIAIKLKLPVISFWGPISPVHRIEDTQYTYFLNKPCSPCIHHTEQIPCGGNNTCMSDMDVNHIQQLIKDILKNDERAFAKAV